jgi:hypothetical protein
MALITFSLSTSLTFDGSIHSETQTFQVEASKSQQFTRTLGTAYEDLFPSGQGTPGATYVLITNTGAEPAHVRIGAGGSADYGFFSLVEGGHMFFSDSLTYDIFGVGDWGINSVALRSLSATGTTIEVVIIEGIV